MKKYNTIINFVEPTMILKRVTVDTFNNTYPLGHDYTEGFNYIDYDIIDYNPTLETPVTSHFPKNLYKAGYFINTQPIEIKGYYMGLRGLLGGEKRGYYYGDTTISVYKNQNETPIFTYILKQNITTEFNENVLEPNEGQTVGVIDKSLVSPGDTLKIVYSSSREPDSYTYVSGELEYIDITIATAIESVPRLQLNEVCRRIFEGSLGRREKDPVPFRLDAATEQWFSTITAPEYCFTRSTLYEVLMEIGGTKEVNAVPRLLWNDDTNAFDTITFVKQGDSQDEYTLPDGVKISGKEVDVTSEDYCEEFDSYAENMVNTLDATRGSIVEPGANGDTYFWYAPTSEELTITDNTAIIGTSRPIYRVIKLMANYGGNSADITPYLFEAAEYDNLTSYKGSYPYAKEWALRYAQGDNKITGLCLKAETITDIGQYTTNMAIYNILWRTGVITDGSKPGICNIGFNITYIPINTGRVKQRKPYLDWKGSGTQFYNQGGNVVEMDYYGNHLKNRLAKVGNPIKKITFRLKDQTPPKIGQVYYDEEDEELLYISQVDREQVV